MGRTAILILRSSPSNSSLSPPKVLTIILSTVITVSDALPNSGDVFSSALKRRSIVVGSVPEPMSPELIHAVGTSYVVAARSNALAGDTSR